MPLRSTIENIEAAARALFARWMSMTKHPIGSWDGLKQIAQEMGCDIEVRPCISSYAPEKHYPKPQGLALVNSQQEPRLIIRGMAHELAHHALFWWSAFGWPWHWSFMDEYHRIKDIEEAICNFVADLVLPLPEGTQANGKPAIPASSGPVLRCGWHNTIPSSMGMPAHEIEEADAGEATLFLPAETNLNSPI